MNLKGLAYYVTAHGYGHGVRSADILRTFCAEYPNVPVTVVTDLPADFLRSRLKNVPVRLREGSFDVGMVQLDSVRVDVPATLEKVRELHGRRETLIAQEVEFLQLQDIGLVVCDIPAIPLAAAKRAGVPCIAVGNFSWDWIYEEFVETDGKWREQVELLKHDYASADLLLKLPFSAEMSAFARSEPVPMLSSPGCAKREEIARLYAADVDRRWVLISFTSLEWSADAIKNVCAIEACEFFSVLPLAWPESRIHAVDRRQISFFDLMASVDVLVSKPGYGLISECIANGKPLIYVDRTNFREYAVLERAVRKYLRQCHISASDLYAGRLEASLADIDAAGNPPERMEAGGDKVVADKLAEYLGIN
ncbi:MAG: hypothetical protein KJ626_04485 [Verrucomicrobia bacterium]|nr:hypothetical protein [Verrucomicrobiota bacterium]